MERPRGKRPVLGLLDRATQLIILNAMQAFFPFNAATGLVELVSIGPSALTRFADEHRHQRRHGSSGPPG
jgi:hypothetical protein